MFALTLSILVAIAMACASVLLHYECLCFLEKIVERLGSSRRRLLVTMIGLLAAHIVEIWLYAGAYVALGSFPELGSIVRDAAFASTPLDAVYYSAMVYTTVGFGDMIPTGGLRLITATEALIGLSLITWSASFTFFQMQAMFGKDE